MSLGENIYKHRSSKNWSQTELADALNVSRQSVSKWENDLATPDLDKLIKMKLMFNITLDDLVFGAKPEPQQSSEKSSTPSLRHPFRTYAGMVLMMFGMIFFLLSVFWGDHLALGEEFGELASAVIVLISVALIVPYDFKVLAVCTVIFLIYSFISFGILHVTNVSHSIFVLISSTVILIWFIICGEHATKEINSVNDAK